MNVCKNKIKREFLMHDETNNKPFVLTPHELTQWERIR